MAAIRVSIVIPVHNGAKYLREAIDSALAQTYKNTEIIVVNDGSTDNGATEDVARSYGDMIRYLSKNNGGVASALNAGIEIMTGDYFSWLSHDDLYEPHKIACQVEMIEELGDPDAVVFSDYVNVDAENRELYPVRMDHDLLERKPLYAIFRGALHGCTLLISRKSLLEVGMFKNLPTTQDYDLWFRLIRKYLFRHIPEILVRSRLHPEQGSRAMEATAEAEHLWIRMMSELTPEEIATLEDSEREFFAGMVKFLSSTPYRNACDYAKRRAGKLFLLRERVRDLSKEILGGLGLLPYARTLKHMLRTGNALMAPRFWVHVVFLEMKQRRRDEVLLDAICRILDKVDPRLRS